MSTEARSLASTLSAGQLFVARAGGQLVLSLLLLTLVLARVRSRSCLVVPLMYKTYSSSYGWVPFMATEPDVFVDSRLKYSKGVVPELMEVLLGMA